MTDRVFKTVAEQGSSVRRQILPRPPAINYAVSADGRRTGIHGADPQQKWRYIDKYGEHLLPYVNAVLNSDESLQQAISEFNGLKRGKAEAWLFLTVYVPTGCRTLCVPFKRNTRTLRLEVFQGTYDDVTYWLKNGVVDLGFLSTSSAKDIPIEPLWRDPLLYSFQKEMKKTEKRDYMDIDEIRNHQFRPRESTDADIQNFLKENLHQYPNKLTWGG